MRVLMLSKALVVGIYQRKLELIARHGVDLLAVVPPSWRDERGEQPLERVYTDGYQLTVSPVRFNGNFHLHYYPELHRILRDFKPDIVHIDEEPYNLATWHALYGARCVGAKSLFFSWQNINRRYPPPFSWGEKWVLNTVDFALMGTASAADIWREKGYTGRFAIMPQVGTDPELFQPQPRPDRPFTIGFLGRMVEEKGVRLILPAFAQLPAGVHLRMVGGGPLRDELREQSQSMGLSDRVAFIDQVASTDMPAQYAAIDALILPSLTRPNWKEQFGRVLVEAMACGVPVIGSDSGAIPGVIGAGGLIIPEGDVPALADAMRRLLSDPDLRQRLGQAGRAHVLANFTHASIAQATVDVYRQLLSQ